MYNFILLKSNRLNILNNTLWVWTSVFSYSYVDSDFYTTTIEKFAKGVRVTLKILILLSKFKIAAKSLS